MSEKTKIAWCDSTINFWSGCTKVSDGCKFCYAEALSNRNLGPIGKWGKGAPRQLHESAFRLAEKLNLKPWICDECGTATVIPGRQAGINSCEKCGEPRALHRRRIFSLSLGDWLDEEVPIEWLARMLDTIRCCDQVTWILCTKHPENFLKRFGDAYAHNFINEGHSHRNAWLENWRDGTPPKNIILLTSVENQEQADKRIPEFLKVPAACRGLSCEPLLSEVNLGLWLFDPTAPIGWVIAGGESGPKARPCSIEWLRFLSIQTQETETPFFCKQLGSKPVEGKITDKKGADPAEWPQDLRVQEWPAMP